MQQSSKIILSAPPGSGKTTCVPPALIKEEWLRGKKIILLEPRRLAARHAAGRMAANLGELVGQTVGYQVRHERKISHKTRIEVLTEGILVRRLQNDPELKDVGLVIFDEFHLRSIHADLALALCLDVQEGLREDLKLLLMSATLDIKNLTDFLGNPAVVKGEGQCYPVAVHYLEQDKYRKQMPKGPGYSFFDLIPTVSKAIKTACDTEHGDILVFLPGAGEINAVIGQLKTWAKKCAIHLFPLYGDLPKKIQDKAITPVQGGRRVVLTTSIAETSLTIEGVRVVIDCGWSRVSRFDPNTGLSALKTIRVSQASAEQRRGRAGRLEPGICYRLWPKQLEHQLKKHDRPEIFDADLAQLALELAVWGVDGPGDLPWLDSPPEGHYGQAVDLLSILGALKNGKITTLGKQMAVHPFHPRLAMMLETAKHQGGYAVACDLAGLLSERDVIKKMEGGKPADLEIRLSLLRAYRAGDRQTLSAYNADSLSCAKIDKLAKQLKKGPHKKSANKQVTAGSLLALAYPDRVAILRKGSTQRYLMSNGRGARFAAVEQLSGQKYLVAAHLDAGKTEGRIFLAASISQEELYRQFADIITSFKKVFWDEKLKRVSSLKEDRLFSLVLKSVQFNDVDPGKVAQVMLDGIASMGIECLPWDVKASKYRARIQWVHTMSDEACWPDFSDKALLENLEWIAPYVAGMSSRQHLGQLNMYTIIKNMLDWPMQQKLEKEVPTHITVPSGSKKPLAYHPGKPPVLAVRLQEMFGLAETPTIAGGRVPVMLHLLSPASRPIQVTQDLSGFWNNTYVEVKKELKGRYPKHHWPDDPWKAVPTARAKSKK